VIAPPKGVILDRDGTLIDFHRDEELGAVVSAFHPHQIRLLPGVIEGLRLFAEAGYLLAIATNQPGAAKGQTSWAAIERTNEALVAKLRRHGISIAAVAVCGHHPDGGPGGDARLVRACDCRKPAPGLLLALCRDLDLDPDASIMIGDTEADLEAARRAGLRAGILRDAARCELCPGRARPADLTPDIHLAPGPLQPPIVAARLDALARCLLA
jgi:D-glycero-D-manno-heptose 1,7-bisphosphate phosphatase